MINWRFLKSEYDKFGQKTYFDVDGAEFLYIIKTKKSFFLNSFGRLFIRVGIKYGKMSMHVNFIDL